MCTHVQILQSDYFNSKQLNKRFKKFYNLILSFSGFYFNKNMYFLFFILLKNDNDKYRKNIYIFKINDFIDSILHIKNNISKTIII